MNDFVGVVEVGCGFQKVLAFVLVPYSVYLRVLSRHNHGDVSALHVTLAISHITSAA